MKNTAHAVGYMIFEYAGKAETNEITAFLAGRSPRQHAKVDARLRQRCSTGEMEQAR